MEKHIKHSKIVNSAKSLLLIGTSSYIYLFTLLTILAGEWIFKHCLQIYLLIIIYSNIDLLPLNFRLNQIKGNINTSKLHCYSRMYSVKFLYDDYFTPNFMFGVICMNTI